MKAYFVYVERVLHSDYNVTKAALGFTFIISDCCYHSDDGTIESLITKKMIEEFGEIPVDQVEVIKQLNCI